MKKLMIILFAVLFLSSPVIAGELLLNGVVATGASLEASFPASGHNTSRQAVECHYVDANDSITALVIEIEITLDPDSVKPGDATWYSVASHTFTATELGVEKAIFFLSEATNKRARLNITTLTGAAAVDLIYATYEPNY